MTKPCSMPQGHPKHCGCQSEIDLSRENARLEKADVPTS